MVNLTKGTSWVPSEFDHKERVTTTRLFLIIAAVVVALAVVVVFVIAPTMSAELAPGLGLKPAAIIAFVITVVTIVIMSIAAGDGLIGEIQFTLPAFFVFFLVVWILIAWVF